MRGAVIVWITWGLLRDSVKLSLAAVPQGIDPAAVRSHLEGLPGVVAIHDLHVWPMSTTETALTSHLVIPGGHPADGFLMRAASELGKGSGSGTPSFGSRRRSRRARTPSAPSRRITSSDPARGAVSGRPMPSALSRCVGLVHKD